VHLVRDLLDKEVVDRNGRPMGRVERVILDGWRGSLRVVAIEIGAPALAGRLSPLLGRWVMAILLACGVSEGQPVRIHVHQILDVTDLVKVDLAFGETAASNVERRLRGFVSALPGANR
jgi:sporulation protein YlmC with PRC-barrel domain